jgi:hypothetical protein
MDDDDKVFPKEAAADFISYAASTVGDKRWRERVGLHAIKVGGRLRFQEKDLLALLARSRERHPGD